MYALHRKGIGNIKNSPQLYNFTALRYTSPKRVQKRLKITLRYTIPRRVWKRLKVTLWYTLPKWVLKGLKVTLRYTLYP